MLRTLSILATLALVAIAVPARAVVVPVAPIGDNWFAAPNESVQVIAVTMTATPVAGEDAPTWDVDAEMTLRNVDVEPVTVDFAAVLTDAEVWLDGVPAGAASITVRQDPAYPEHTYGAAALVRRQMPLGGELTVRVRGRVSGRVDALGRERITLPTHALGLFADVVTAGRLSVGTNQRAVAPTSTLSHGTTYDDPVNETTWRLRQWEPRIPFELAYSTPWSALMLVAEVESCPAPWDVVGAMTGGDLSRLQTLLAPFDDASLRFCATLPDVLRGRPFESERTRQQLAAMTLERYTGAGDAVPLYTPNPAWTEEIGTDAEGIYARSLRSALERRAAVPAAWTP